MISLVLYIVETCLVSIGTKSMTPLTRFKPFLLVTLALAISACFIYVITLVSAYCHLQNKRKNLSKNL